MINQIISAANDAANWATSVSLWGLALLSVAFIVGFTLRRL